MRSGLRIRGERGEPIVKRALIRYAQWLRTKHDFPIRVPVYLLGRAYVRTFDGRRVAASFFAPASRSVEPYIRIATGDYREIRSKSSRDDTLAAYIISMSHEVVHYQQWLRTGRTWERGVEGKALRMMKAYADHVRHP